jgi:hypothetical protein
MKPPFEVGDLVQLSFRGKLTLGLLDNEWSVGIVTRTDRNIDIHRCEVQWANKLKPIMMHWDFIEEVTKKT